MVRVFVPLALAVAANAEQCHQIIKTKPPASCPGDQKCCVNLFGHRCCSSKEQCLSGMGFTPPMCMPGAEVASVSNNATDPSPNDQCTICEQIVKQVAVKVFDECDTLCKKTPIDAVCEKLCTLVQQQATPEKVCQKLKMCSGDANMLPPGVIKEIEKLVCQAVRDEIPEDNFAQTTCADLEKVIKFLPDKPCEDVVKTIYEDTIKTCPPASGKSIGDSNMLPPIPPGVVKEIEKLVCEAVRDEIPEDNFAETTCADLEKVLKFLPNKPCEDVVKTIYEDTIKSCPPANGKSIVV